MPYVRKAVRRQQLQIAQVLKRPGVGNGKCELVLGLHGELVTRHVLGQVIGTRGGHTRREIDVLPGAEHWVQIAAHHLGVLADFRVEVAVVAAQPPMLVHVIDEVELAPPQRGVLDVVGPLDDRSCGGGRHHRSLLNDRRSGNPRNR